jgi:hypothetical protein
MRYCLISLAGTVLLCVGVALIGAPPGEDTRWTPFIGGACLGAFANLVFRSIDR